MNNPIVAAGHKLLSIPICYDAFQSAVGSVKFRSEFVVENANRFESSCVIDLGCGTASTANLLSKDIEYIGVDTSSKYLNTASHRIKNKHLTLIESDIANSKWVEQIPEPKKALGLALGIYHHITDEQLDKAIRNLAAVTAPQSTVISLDPVIDEKTTKLASWFARNDRGKFIREPNYYRDIFGNYGFEIELEITRNDFRIPYDLLLMKATRLGK